MTFLRSLPWLRSAVEIGRLAAFVVFIVLGVRVAWLEWRKRPAERAVLALVAWALIVSCAVGVTQVEAWPFSNWALVHNISHTEMMDWLLYGTDANGRLYRLDYRFMHPMPYEDFDTWMKYYLLRTSAADQRQIAGFLLDRANAARIRFLRTGDVSTNRRYLGFLAAPYHFDRPPQWRTPADVPPTDFTGLQIWQAQWSIEDRLRDESRVKRSMIFEYRR